jgi:enolase-phosphatase E1
MIVFQGRGILLDVEGTTSSIRYVYDTLFPHARRELAGFLARRWDDPAVRRACEQVARDAEAASLEKWLGASASRADALERVCAHVLGLMDADVKATGLKELQGLIWEEGYAAGRLRSHVYPDVAPALRRWAQQGLDVRIFSSGSVTAQKVFFANTEEGDLLGLLRGHYDTTVGAKRSPPSYLRIATDMGLAPNEILFLSDVSAEVDAAASAGMRTGLVVRPGNPPTAEGHGHPTVTDFGEIRTDR